ncbi:MAG: hypothetical protein WCK88_04420 [bacterium]
MSDFSEQNYGEFDGKKVDDLMKEYNFSSIEELQQMYRNNTTENVDTFRERVMK